MTLNELIDMLVDYRDKGRFERNGRVIDTNGREEVIFKATINNDLDKSTMQAMFEEKTADVFISPVSMINYHGNHIRILGYRCASTATYMKDAAGNNMRTEDGYFIKHAELIV